VPCSLRCAFAPILTAPPASCRRLRCGQPARATVCGRGWFRARVVREPWPVVRRQTQAGEMSTSIELLRGEDDDVMVRIVPPQTSVCGAKPTKGAYCFSIDVSGRCRPGLFCARLGSGRVLAASWLCQALSSTTLQ
jgi:hypothetical protein